MNCLGRVLKLYSYRKWYSWPDIAWQTVYGHFRRWAKAGLWDQAMQQMKWLAGKDLGMVDATHIKVHRDGANPAGGQEKQGHVQSVESAHCCISMKEFELLAQSFSVTDAAGDTATRTVERESAVFAAHELLSS